MERVMPIEWDILPLLAQYHIDCGNFDPKHVAYQQLFHLLLVGIYGHENFPKEMREQVQDFANLKSMQETIQLLKGRAMTDLLRGRCGVGGYPSTPADVFKTRNYGGISSKTVSRSLPQRNVKAGPQITDILNLFAALKSAKALSFSPTRSRLVYPVVLGMDGAAISPGLQTDEQRLVNVGLVGDEQTVQDVEAINKLSEEEVRLKLVTIHLSANLACPLSLAATCLVPKSPSTSLPVSVICGSLLYIWG
jgi:hypothetical protein